MNINQGLGKKYYLFERNQSIVFILNLKVMLTTRSLHVHNFQSSPHICIIINI